MKSFLHFGTIGDVWASLPAIKECSRQTKEKSNIYLVNGQAAHYYEGATHPTLDENGANVMLNQKMINMMLPLLRVQPYIGEADFYNGQKIDIDLNWIRNTFVNQPYHVLSKWYFYVFPDLSCDISKQYIEVPDSDKDFAKGKIIFTRTERYHNDVFDVKKTYSFLKKYETDIIFAGTMREYNNFCMEYDLNIPKLNINDFLELAQAVKQSKAVISNQTQIMQIAEGMKHPRAVELCSYAPNVVTTGENGFEYYSEQSAEYFFHRLNGTLEEYKKEVKAKKAAELQP